MNKNIHVVQTQLSWDKSWRTIGIFSSKKKAQHFAKQYNYLRMKIVTVKLNPKHFEPIEDAYTSTRQIMELDIDAHAYIKRICMICERLGVKTNGKCIHCDLF